MEPRSTKPKTSNPPLNSVDQAERFKELSPDEQAVVLAWIRFVMKRAKTPSRISSYGLKHFCERETGFYITNGAMKGAMLAAGYEPIDETEQNTVYRVRPLQNTSRKTGVKQTLAGGFSGEVYTILDAPVSSQQEFAMLRPYEYIRRGTQRR